MLFLQVDIDSETWTPLTPSVNCNCFMVRAGDQPFKLRSTKDNPKTEVLVPAYAQDGCSIPSGEGSRYSKRTPVFYAQSLTGTQTITTVIVR